VICNIRYWRPRGNHAKPRIVEVQPYFWEYEPMEAAQNCEQAVALDALAASGVVFVLATLRSDFYAQLQQLPAFVDLKDVDGQFDLLPAQAAEIAQMIRQPTLATGLRYEKDAQTQESLDQVPADQVESKRLSPSRGLSTGCGHEFTNRPEKMYSESQSRKAERLNLESGRSGRASRGS